MPTTQDWDAIVVGSGLGGLSTAAYLAANGKNVLVLEQYDVIGGQTHVFRRVGKWEFDVGVHHVENAGPSGNMPKVLAGLGLDRRVEFLEIDPKQFNRVIGPDFELRIPHGWDAFLVNLIAAFPGEEKALRRYVSLLRAAAPATDRTQKGLTSLRATARTVARTGKAAPFFYAPYPAVLAACGLSARAIFVLSAQVADYTSLPHRVPFGFHAGFLNDFVGGGAWFPRGGGQVISANLLNVITANGGQVRTRATVEKILVEGGRVVGVRLEGGEVITAPVVISDADLKRTMLDLVGTEHLPRAQALRAKSWRMGWPFINTYFGVEMDLRTTSAAGTYAIPTWEGTENLAALARTFHRLVPGGHRRDRNEWLDDFGRRMPAFVHSSTSCDPDNARSAPPRCGVVEAMTLVPRDPAFWGTQGYSAGDGGYRRERVYHEMKERLTESMLDRVEAVHPGARAKVLWSEAATPATQERYTRTTGGNAFGLEVTHDQSPPFRPGSTTAIPGLFVAGTSTAWGPGTTGAMMSGVHAAGAVLGRDLFAEVQAGAVFGDTSSLAPEPANWDPLAAARRPELPKRGRKENATYDEDADPIPVHR